ncbi:hypothetical protein, partial [Salmonella enterica]|uniref:hypothetical protein n=1 Tax=Salmonella enterica TaxID=28901 RepID=UPI0015FED868
MGWTKQDGIGMYRRLKRTFYPHKNKPYVDFQVKIRSVYPQAAGKNRFFKIKKKLEVLLYKYPSPQDKEKKHIAAFACKKKKRE